VLQRGWKLVPSATAPGLGQGRLCAFYCTGHFDEPLKTKIAAAVAAAIFDLMGNCVVRRMHSQVRDANL